MQFQSRESVEVAGRLKIVTMEIFATEVVEPLVPNLIRRLDDWRLVLGAPKPHPYANPKIAHVT